jgi:hypothetical protein
VAVGKGVGGIGEDKRFKTGPWVWHVSDEFRGTAVWGEAAAFSSRLRTHPKPLPRIASHSPPGIEMP